MNGPTPPTKAVKRDGRVVDFDADRISRALFAASESIGRSDAFLARELADGVVHFLSQESDADTIPTREIAEVVVKVVRELGQPALAAAFEEHGRQRIRRPAGAEPHAGDSEMSLRYSHESSLAQLQAECARRYTLQTVYTRDLAAAQEAGLLTLTGLETPDDLASCVLGPPVSLTGDVVAALEQARCFVGRQVALDGLEHLAAATGQTPRELAAAVALGLRLTGLQGVVNLNCATPPSWAGPLAEGPLFASRQPDRDRLEILADELREELLRLSEPALRIDWHVATKGGARRLHRPAAVALEGANIGFTFDRPRRPVALAEGLDRGHPATLLSVGLNLPALANQPGMLADPGRFLQRLGSLVRLALSAAVQKRRFLREKERARGNGSGVPLTSNFLLDRARFVVTPIGLDAVVGLFTEWGLCNGGESLELGRQIVQRLCDVLRQDARSAQMDACLDGPFAFGLDGSPAQSEAVAGLTPWDATASAQSQMRAADVLHGLAEHGTLALLVPRDEAIEPEALVEWLARAWRRTDVVRLRVVRQPGKAIP